MVNSFQSQFCFLFLRHHTLLIVCDSISVHLCKMSRDIELHLPLFVYKLCFMRTALSRCQTQCVRADRSLHSDVEWKIRLGDMWSSTFMRCECETKHTPFMRTFGNMAYKIKICYLCKFNHAYDLSTLERLKVLPNRIFF